MNSRRGYIREDDRPSSVVIREIFETTRGDDDARRQALFEAGFTCWGAKTPIARIRRGRWVPIPRPWMGQVPTRQRIGKRQSKLTRKQRNEQKWGRHGSHSPRRRSEARAPRVEDWEAV